MKKRTYSTLDQSLTPMQVPYFDFDGLLASNTPSGPPPEELAYDPELGGLIFPILA